MQHRFTADIGDFGKYGLLRILAAPPFTLGIIWYLVEHAGRANEGRAIRYLAQPDRFRSCDPPLFDLLAHLTRTGNRTVPSIQAAGLFPPTTLFYDEYLPSIKGPLTPQERRGAWYRCARLAIPPCDLVFLDPDNGLAPPSIHITHRNAVAYVFPEEILPFLSRGQSLILYHHLSRRWTASAQISLLHHRIAELTGVIPFSLRFHRGGSRIFIILPTPEHRALLTTRSVYLAERSPWSGHFTLAVDGKRPSALPDEYGGTISPHHHGNLDKG